MAHLFQQVRLDKRAPQTTEESRAWDHVKRVFGRNPSSIRCISSAKQKEAYVVKVQWNLDQTLEFICVGGLLAGIPAKRPGKK